MRVFERYRSLHIQVLFWLIVPFTVILALALGTILYAFQNNTIQLVLERHQQMANLAAVTVSQGLEGNAHVLEALRDQEALRSPSQAVRENALIQSVDALVDFSAGVVQVDSRGQVITAVPGLPLEQWTTLPDRALMQQLLVSSAPVFSDVQALPDGKKIILIGVAMVGEQGEPSGAIIGGIDLSSPDNSVSAAIQKLTTSMPGIAYLVDTQGVVISQPAPLEMDESLISRPYTGQAVDGSRNGSLWNDPEGGWHVGAEALVEPSGWRVVIKEPWEAIIAPARQYTLFIVGFVLLALALFFYLSWIGTRRVTEPVQELLKSTQLLASGEAAPEIKESGIQEIDDLRSAFAQMAQQIFSYRDGLRYYVEAITRSQEDERLRIARELHDDTTQNLLAAYRRTELMSATETDPQKHQQLLALHDMLGQTLEGVRLISQDLRPMMLDDLGFVPAAQMLVRKAHEGRGAVPDARLEVRGTVLLLPAGVELAMYRVIQEALNNVRKHAQATSVLVTLEYQPGFVRLTIADDGVGFAVPASFTELVQSNHLGLMGIQERVWSVGGRLHVESIIDEGTKLTIAIPLAVEGI